MTADKTKQQDSKEFGITDIRIIRLHRYIYSKAYKPVNNNGNNGLHEKFYLFDFFDCMTHIKDDNLQYEDCMGLEKTVVSENGHTVPSNNILVSQLWTLVRTDDDDIQNENDPFLYATGKEKKHLSDKPFLAIITVNINPEHYIHFLNKENTENKDKIENEKYDEKEFIRECIKSIRRKIDNVKEKNWNGNPLCPLTRVFVSMNYGDFCVAVRSASMNDAYAILSELRRPSKTDEKDDNEYQIRFSTFTIMGLETGVFEDKPANIESDASCLNEEYYISLRLSVHSNLISRFIDLKDKFHGISIKKADQAEDQKHSKDMRIPYGLFGRYEVSIDLDLAQFNMLYPLLCNHKLNIGNRKKIDEIPLPQSLENKDDYNKHMLYLIDFGIRNDYIHVINERAILKDLYPDSICDVREKIDNDTYNVPFKKAYDDLSMEIDNLCTQDYDLPRKRKIFFESMRLVKDLFKTYTPLCFQHDSRLNIWFLFALMYALVKLIKKNLEEISNLMKLGGTKNEEYAVYLCDNLIDSMNISIKSINSFAKSIQSRNLQTIYSPNYEIESQVDLEKYIIAFTEFLRILIKKYFKNSEKEIKILPRRFITIITMDFDAKKVMANPLFESINYDKGKKTPVPVKLIPMSIPTFECLIRAYDLLPLLCHETSHYFRFLPRDERNAFVISMVLQRLSKYIARRWISMCNLDRNYIHIHSLEKVVWESIYKAIIAYCPFIEWTDYSYDYLRERIQDFLNSYIFRNETRLSPSISRKETIVSSMCFLFNKGQAASNFKGYKKTIEKYFNIIKYLNEDTHIELPNSLTEKLKHYIETHPKPSLSKIYAKFSEPDLITKKLSISLCDLNLISHFIGESNPDIIREIADSIKKLGLIINEDSIMISKEIVNNIIKELCDLALGNSSYQLHKFFYEDKFSPYITFDAYKKAAGKVSDTLQNKMDSVENAIIQTTELAVRLPESFSDEFEKHINIAYKNIMTRIRKFRKALPEVSQYSQSFSAELNHKSKILKDKVKSYLQTLCDIKYQYISAMQIIKVSSIGIPVCSNRIRDGIIKSVKENLSLALSNLIGKEKWSGDNLILTSSQIYPFISGLCSSADDMENFTENILQCILSIGTNEEEEAIEDSLGYYREVAADLGMCAAVGFNALGYLKFYTRYYHREDELKNDYLKDVHSERAVAVLTTLIAYDAKYSMAHFFDQIEKHIQKTFAETVSQMYSELPDSIKQEYEDLWKSYEDETTEYTLKFVKYLECIRINYEMAADTKKVLSPEELLKKTDEVSMPQYRFMIDRFNELCSFLSENNRKILLSKYYERFDRIILMLDLLKRIIPDFIGGIDKESTKHFLKIYSKIKHKTEPVFRFEDIDDSIDSRRAIGEYFNTANPYEGRINAKMSNDMLKNTLSFILKYYYKNRLALSNNPTFDDNWIDSLTGGN